MRKGFQPKIKNRMYAYGKIFYCPQLSLSFYPSVSEVDASIFALFQMGVSVKNKMAKSVDPDVTSRLILIYTVCTDICFGLPGWKS